MYVQRPDRPEWFWSDWGHRPTAVTWTQRAASPRTARRTSSGASRRETRARKPGGRHRDGPAGIDGCVFPGCVSHSRRSSGRTSGRDRRQVTQVARLPPYPSPVRRAARADGRPRIPILHHRNSLPSLPVPGAVPAAPFSCALHGDGICPPTMWLGWMNAAVVW